MRNPRFRRDVASRLVALDVKTGGARRGRQTSPKVEREAARLERSRETSVPRVPRAGKHERWAARASGSSAGSAAWNDGCASGPRRSPVSSTVSSASSGARLRRRVVAHGEGPHAHADARRGGPPGGEAIDAGLLDDLEPSEVVGLLSAVMYEGRERVPLSGEMPTARRRNGTSGSRLWRRIRRTEDEHQVQLCRELEAGFATPIHRWAEGEALDDILAETEMAPGDFVRNCKQLVDLLRQIEEVAPPRPRRRSARAARRSSGRRRLHRGVATMRPR